MSMAGSLPPQELNLAADAGDRRGSCWRCSWNCAAWRGDGRHGAGGSMSNTSCSCLLFLCDSSLHALSSSPTRPSSSLAGRGCPTEVRVYSWPSSLMGVRW